MSDMPGGNDPGAPWTLPSVLWSYLCIGDFDVRRGPRTADRRRREGDEPPARRPPKRHRPAAAAKD
jgi:hypothetical protein